MDKLTQEQIDRIIEQPYISSTILSKELHIPASTIRGYRNRHGIYTKRKFKPPADEFIEKYINRKSTSSLALEYNVDHHVITEYAKHLGIYVEPKLLLTPDQQQEIIEAYYINTSTELALKYHVSPSRIAQIWTQSGLKGKAPRIYYYDEHYFSNINSYDKAYFLGFIGADGCIYYPNDSRQTIIKIAISKVDVKILEVFKEKLNSNKPIYVGDYYATFEVSSDIMGEDLANLGMHNRKTYDNCIANIDDTLMPHLIRGFFDGDGSIGNVDNGTYISDVNISFAGFESNLLKISRYLEKHHIFTSFSEDCRKVSSKTNDRFGNLTCPNNTSKYCLLKLMYEDMQDCFLDRKYSLAKKYIDYIENSENARDKQIVCYYKYAVKGVG